MIYDNYDADEFNTALAKGIIIEALIEDGLLDADKGREWGRKWALIVRKPRLLQWLFNRLANKPKDHGKPALVLMSVHKVSEHALMEDGGNKA